LLLVQLLLLLIQAPLPSSVIPKCYLIPLFSLLQVLLAWEELRCFLLARLFILKHKLFLGGQLEQLALISSCQFLEFLALALQKFVGHLSINAVGGTK
jgi:hypothetical protein